MRKIINDVNIEKKIFYCHIGNRKVGFYLTNKLAKIFLPYLNNRVIVDFEVSGKTKTIDNEIVNHVAFFKEIRDLKTKKYIYSHTQLKKEMLHFLKEKTYFLFLDLEMTIAIPYQKRFKPEIIQYGLILSDKSGNVITESGNYVKAVKQVPLSKRTIKFLSIDEKEYYDKAILYQQFYDELSNIITKYHPKIVVWGKNDILALEHSYLIHSTKNLTEATDFVDLLKLHKDYFNLNNDLGLFKAYETYYLKSYKQVHDAKDDASVTKEVFKAFLDYITNENKEEIK